MKTSFKPVFSFICLIFIIPMLFLNSLVSGQGRFVRGVEITEFSLSGTAADFFVSPAGNDNWSGTLSEPNLTKTDGPFATIERAKAAVSRLKEKVYQLKKKAIDKRFKGTPHQFGVGRDILVLIRQGTYTLESSLTFTPADGGERVETDLPTGAFEYHELKDCFVTYAAYPGETPVISGGEKISGWEKKSNGVWSAAVKRSEINELYANGKRLTLARTPNTGYFLTDGQPSDSVAFKFKAGDLKSWKDLETSRIHMTVRWGGIHSSLAKVDTKSRTAWLKESSPDMLIIIPKYYVENLEALLDTAGEWYLNNKTLNISFIPEPELGDPNLAAISFPRLENLIDVSGTREKPVRNLRFYNLKFENTRSGGKGAIAFQYSKNCELLKSRIGNVNQVAIRFGLGCYHNLISKNVINDAKGSGINVSGVPKPEKWEDMVSDNFIIYNKITNIPISATGISTYNATRSTVSHNYVSNVGSYGITIGSWPNIEETSDGSHLAEYNHVSFTNMKRDDEGGIAVYGLSHGSVVRNNLVHDVHPAATNENVGFFFQNMAYGFLVSNNIFYNLKQGELKYCASYPIDNIYENNHLIDAPVNQPEEIIEGKPELNYSDLTVKAMGQPVTGSDFSITATIANSGSTGMDELFLYVDGKVASSQKLPFIAKNKRKIEFRYKFFDPGKHTIAIGTTAAQEVTVSGDPLYVIYRNLNTQLSEIPVGDSLFIKTEAQNVRAETVTKAVELLVDGIPVATREIKFKPNETRQIGFSYRADAGTHKVTIANQPPLQLKVYPVNLVDLVNAPMLTYCSATAKPCKFNYDIRKNHFEITAAGTDFLHAEDSYGAIFLKGAITGNFVATVKVVGFSEGISEWFRAGIFVRNDMAKSSNSKSSTLGSFLLFSTTKRCGAQWDEFGDGCMHNTKSRNYGVDQPIPVWLKLVRHGNRFSGYYSFDGKNWIISRESGDIPGLAPKLDIGLAGGANDQKISTVIFGEFRLEVEKK